MEENNIIRLYYGAGDYSTCMAEISLDELWREMTPYTRRSCDATVTLSDMWNGYYHTSLRAEETPASAILEDVRQKQAGIY